MPYVLRQKTSSDASLINLPLLNMFRMFGLSTELLPMHKGKVPDKELALYSGKDGYAWVIKQIREQGMLGLGHELIALENMIFFYMKTMS